MKQSGRQTGNTNFLANDSTPQVHPPPQRYNHNPHLQYGPSLAEKTISSYKTPNDNIPTRRHNQTGAEHPYDATTDYLSMYPLGWVGCYACGDQGHTRSVDCPLWQAGRVNKKAFFLELHAHKPWTRRRQPNSDRSQSYRPSRNDGPNAPPSNYSTPSQPSSNLPPSHASTNSFFPTTLNPNFQLNSNQLPTNFQLNPNQLPTKFQPNSTQYV